MTPNTHIIDRQIIELTLTSHAAAFAIQNRLDNILLGKVSDALDDVLSGCVPPEVHIRLDRLELDLGEMPLHDLGSEFTERFRRRLSEALSDIVQQQSMAERELVLPGAVDTTNEPATRQPGSEKGESRELEILLHFLKTGSLPWWSETISSRQKFDQLLKQVCEVPARVVAAVHPLLQRASVRARLISQFSDEALTSLPAADEGIGKRLPVLSAKFVSEQIIRVLPLAHDEIRSAFWDFVLRSLAEGESISVIMDFAEKTIHRILSRAAKSRPLEANATEPLGAAECRLWTEIGLLEEPNGPTAVTEETAPRGQESRDFAQSDATEVPGLGDSRANKRHLVETAPAAQGAREFAQSEATKANTDTDAEVDLHRFAVDNSGLVLFAPFLGTFFANIGLTEDGKFKDRRSHFRAVAVLQFIAIGESDVPEPFLILNKLLCGINLQAPMVAIPKLTASEEKECATLIEAVIGHWSALKKTSVDGFRTTFLQRSGLLEKTEMGYHLRVENKAFDILLEKLPWSISMIKLSWMKEPLQVEWSAM